MGLRRHIGNFFGFTRAQVNAFLILLPLLVVFIFSEPVYRRFSNRGPTGNIERAKLDSLISRWQPVEEVKPNENEPDSVAFFYFDPNTATPAELMSLGFSSRLANQLVNYRNKGGRFQHVHDLLRLYAMDSALYRKLERWVVIRSASLPKKGKDLETNIASGNVMPFDLNQADTLHFQMLKGIGAVRARRIVKYREALGGFVSAHQLYEVYGLDSALVQHITNQTFLDPLFKPEQININEASEAQLAAHPYISKAVARAIVTYRFQHGRFRSADDLADVRLIPAETYRKVKPYLAVE